MKSTTKWLIAAVSVCSIGLLLRARVDHAAVVAPINKPVIVTRLFTGPDGQTQAERIEVKLAGDRLNEISEMWKVTGAEIHRTPPGKVNSWHTAPRRQYVITLSGRGEIELTGGKKISLVPGDIELAEDLTGKGHITRVVGNEDRVTIQLPLADQPGR